MPGEGPTFAGENGKKERILETAPETAEVTEPIANMMPSFRPLSIDLPELKSQFLAPEKNPVILPFMLVTVL